MKCNLIVQINEVTIKDYTLIEDEGIIHLVERYPALKMTYEDDEEVPGRYVIVLAAPDLESLFEFLDFAEIPVKILT